MTWLVIEFIAMFVSNVLTIGKTQSHRIWAGAGLLVVGLMVVSSYGDEKSAPPAQAPRPVAEQLPGLHLLHGPWNENIVHRESVLFLRANSEKPTAKLLYDVERLITVQGANGAHVYEAKRDYRLTSDGSGLELTSGGRIPFLNESELFRAKGAERSIGHRAGQPETSVLFDNGHFFHDHQVEVTYVARNVDWNGYRPSFAVDQLPKTIEKLRKKQALTIAVSGDSISEGYNASAYTKTPPFMPPYPVLVAAQLERTYGSKVQLHNFAVAGWSSGQGLKDLDRVVKAKPDLVIIAYGMNDVGARNPEAFRANIKAMLQQLKEKNSAVEVILVSTMTGNPDWFATPADMFPRYRSVLASFEGPGIALADLTSVWLRILERKRHLDVTGNGVNHPNDYGHRLYAQTILGLLVDPAVIPRRDMP